MTHRSTWVLLATSLLMGGCDGLATGDYRGEPLLRIHGHVHAVESAEAPTAPRAVLLWLSPNLVGSTDNPNFDDFWAGFERVAEEIAIVNEFPAEFTLDLFSSAAASGSPGWRRRWPGVSVRRSQWR